MLQPIGSRKSFYVSLEHLPEMVDFVATFAQSCDFPSSYKLRLEIALEEALTNIIYYSGLTETHTLEIICAIPELRKGVQVHVKDRGVAFNPLNEELQKERLKKVQGFGIQLIRSLLDDVQYYQLHDHNVLVLTKYE